MKLPKLRAYEILQQSDYKIQSDLEKLAYIDGLEIKFMRLNYVEENDATYSGSVVLIDDKYTIEGVGRMIHNNGVIVEGQFLGGLQHGISREVYDEYYRVGLYCKGFLMSFNEYDSKHNLISSKLETQTEITEHKKNAKRSKRSQEILSKNVIETN